MKTEKEIRERINYYQNSIPNILGYGATVVKAVIDLVCQELEWVLEE